jgi:hypothetical protein
MKLISVFSLKRRSFSEDASLSLYPDFPFTFDLLPGASGALPFTWRHQRPAPPASPLPGFLVFVIN